MFGTASNEGRAKSFLHILILCVVCEHEAAYSPSQPEGWIVSEGTNKTVSVSAAVRCVFVCDPFCMYNIYIEQV